MIRAIGGCVQAQVPINSHCLGSRKLAVDDGTANWTAPSRRGVQVAERRETSFSGSVPRSHSDRVLLCGPRIGSIGSPPRDANCVDLVRRWKWDRNVDPGLPSRTRRSTAPVTCEQDTVSVASFVFRLRFCLGLRRTYPRGRRVCHEISSCCQGAVNYFVHV